ncbi:hypothetical protein P389DRAFT_195658 [Cystobasidium minutum MCA 4210]|uniref:uncharacterized protein n=1 Tax=Cystobasidium minutum MCA 4210 TaxID=1397322 RepID=UPI0034CD01B5|eukprot:jgi/Rhomi1/195658/gm1.3872_g
MLQALRPAASHAFRAPRASLINAARMAAPRTVRFATTKAYTPDHEWVKYDSDSKIGIIGITEYAQKSLGDVVYVELPTAGSEVAKHDQIGAVESVKAASDIYAPVSGTIEEINEELGDQPALLNRSPEENGWLCKIKLNNADELKELMDDKAYAAHCAGED